VKTLKQQMIAYKIARKKLTISERHMRHNPVACQQEHDKLVEKILDNKRQVWRLENELIKSGHTLIYSSPAYLRYQRGGPNYRKFIVMMMRKISIENVKLC
jgi:hypothetical protein